MHILMAVTGQIPPHVFLDFELGEWIELIGIVTFIAGIVAWVIRIAIVNPTKISNDALSNSIRELSKKVEGIGDNADRVHDEHDRRLDEHDVRLAKHDEEFKTIFNQMEKK